MINFKKGPALSLHQVNTVALAPISGPSIQAGMIVQVTEAGGALSVAVVADSTSKTELVGFAINNQADGDSIESGKIGVYLLDGASVVETTCVTGDVNYTNYPLGSLVTANTDGTVKAAGAGDRVIGQVEGIRDLPAAEVINGFKVQGTATFLAIKLVA